MSGQRLACGRDPLEEPLPITIPGAQIAEIIAHALEADPEECCGILLGNDGVVTSSRRVANVHDERATRYTMDPLELVHAEREAESRGEEFVAFYHSHPHSPARPSETDIDNAVESEWTDPYYVVVSLAEKTRPVVRAFQIAGDRQVKEVFINTEGGKKGTGSKE